MVGMAVRGFLELTKPKQTALLMVTMYGAYLAAGGLSPIDIVILSAADFLAIAGTTAMNMYLEFDIDAIMPRTSGRPLPSGHVSMGSALLFSSSLFLAGLFLASLFSKPLAFTILIGFLADILVYTDIVKRRTPYNILLGGVAGGMPALGGWAMARGSIGLSGLLLAAVVMAWIPMHIWFIASYFYDDYRLAGIPMLPVISGPARASRATEISLAIMSALTWTYLALESRGLIAALATTMISVVAMKKIEDFRRNPGRETARSMFKLASPVVAVVFLLEAVEGVFGLL